MIFFSPSFRCDFNFIIANIIYSIYLYFTSSIKKPNRIIRPKLYTADTPIFLQSLLCPLVSLHFQFNYQQSDITHLSIFDIITNKPNRIIHSKLPPPTPPYFYSLCYAPSFRYTSNSTISNPIYRNYLYLTLSLISRTALSARSNPPPKISHNFQVFAIFLPSCRKNLKSSKFIIRLFLRRSAVTPDNITVYALSDVKTGSS